MTDKDIGESLTIYERACSQCIDDLYHVAYLALVDADTAEKLVTEICVDKNAVFILCNTLECFCGYRLVNGLCFYLEDFDIRDFGFNTVNMCADGIGKSFSCLCGYTACGKIGYKCSVHDNTLHCYCITGVYHILTGFSRYTVLQKQEYSFENFRYRQ